MEIELWWCEHPALCGAPGCKTRAYTVVQQIDHRDRLISQIELCDEHLNQRLAVNGLKMHDRRHTMPYL
jgi:hypothetical protein